MWRLELLPDFFSDNEVASIRSLNSSEGEGTMDDNRLLLPTCHLNHIFKRFTLRNDATICRVLNDNMKRSRSNDAWEAAR